MRRVLSNFGSEFQQYSAVEDGVRYTGYRQEMTGVLSRVKEFNAINEVKGPRNSNDWRYGGSIPWAVLTHWLKLTRNKLPDFATSKELRTEFIKWVKAEDMGGFIADDSFLKNARKG